MYKKAYAETEKTSGREKTEEWIYNRDLCGGCGEGAEALRSVFDRRQLQALTDLFRRYCGECQYNVGVGHVLGALNAELTDILTL